MLSTRCRAAMVLATAAVLGGCHTLEGAGTGAMYSMYLLAEAGGSPSGPHSGEAEVVAVVVVLAAGTLIGAAVGAVEDIKELCIYIEKQCQDGWPWDSPEGRELRQGEVATNRP